MGSDSMVDDSADSDDSDPMDVDLDDL